MPRTSFGKFFQKNTKKIMVTNENYFFCKQSIIGQNEKNEKSFGKLFL
jgi:hypothetical protein